MEVTNICIDCHHTFTGSYTFPPGEDEIHWRHPSFCLERDAPNYIQDGALRGSTDPAHWEGGVGSGFGTEPRVPFVVDGALDFVQASVVDATTNGVLCVSCHKVHGSSSAFGMVWELTGPPARPGCDQCHAIEPIN